MTEDFLHYLWKYRHFTWEDLCTTEGQQVEIQEGGYHNHDAGPDFQEALVRIDQQQWAGQVEIHIRSSDWDRHGHQNDHAYDNVILHVVYEHDRAIATSRGTILPTVELRGRFDEYEYWRYEQLISTQASIPCAPQVGELDQFQLLQTLERSLVERFQERSRQIHEILSYHKGDWSLSFYRWMGYGLGLKVNAAPMLTLTRLIPPGYLAKIRGESWRVEALLLGTSGLLSGVEGEEAYPQKLAQEYDFLRRKFDLSTMEAAQWRYSRLRPPAFPDLRIVQLGAIFHRQPDLWARILETRDVTELVDLLDVAPETYWKEHYRLGRKSSLHAAQAGKNTRRNLVVNVIAPFVFEYGRQKDERSYEQRALEWLEQLPPEKHSIAKVYQSLGFPQDSAFHTQGQYHLYRHYCSPRKCLSCGIGVKILKKWTQ